MTMQFSEKYNAEDLGVIESEQQKQENAMQANRVAEIRKLEMQRMNKITWEKFCDWFDGSSDLDKLNTCCLIRIDDEGELMKKLDDGRRRDMIKFARGVLVKLGVHLL